MTLTVRRRRRIVGSLTITTTLAAAVAAGPIAGLVGATTAPIPDDSPHADVLAQGVVEVGTADHVWKLDFRNVTAPVEVPAAGPTFLIPSTAPVRLLGAGGSGLGAYVEPGEAVFVPAGFGYQLAATTPSDVLGVGLAGGSEPGSFPLVGGLYDMELIRDVLAPGERLPVTGAVAALALVSSGSVVLPDGAVLPAGYNLGFTNDFALSNPGPAAAVVLVAALSPIDAPAVVGASLPLPGAAGPGDTGPAPGGGSPTPGATTPGATTPGATTPGATTPGGTTPATTPGGTTPGGTTPGATTPGGGGTEPTTTAGPPGSPTTTPVTTAVTTTAAPTTAAPPTTAGETELTVSLVSCSGGSSLSIRVDASAGSGYRRNVSSVTVSRQNNEGAYTSPTNMLWIGEDTAEHDEWSITNVVGQRQDMGDGLRIVARSSGGQTQTINTTLSASC